MLAGVSLLSFPLATVTTLGFNITQSYLKNNQPKILNTLQTVPFLAIDSETLWSAACPSLHGKIALCLSVVSFIDDGRGEGIKEMIKYH